MCFLSRKKIKKSMCRQNRFEFQSDFFEMPVCGPEFCTDLPVWDRQLWKLYVLSTQPMVGSCVSHENTMLDSTDCYPLFLWNTIRIRQESHEKIHGLFVKISKERRWPGFELGPLDSSSLNRALYHWATKALDMIA